jgi:nitric oxide reductase NorQ protein
MLKDLKPSTRQRFVAIEFDFPNAQREIRIVMRESGIDEATAHTLVTLAQRLRRLRDRGLAEEPSTRLLVAAASLIASGISIKEACRVAIISPLSDDPTLVAAMNDLLDASVV